MANKSKMMLEDDAWDLQATTEVHVGGLGWHEACECRLYPICCSQIWSGPTIHTQRAPRDLNTKFGKGTKSSPNLTNSAVEGTGSVAIYGFDWSGTGQWIPGKNCISSPVFTFVHLCVCIIFIIYFCLPSGGRHAEILYFSCLSHIPRPTISPSLVSTIPSAKKTFSIIHWHSSRAEGKIVTIFHIYWLGCSSGNCTQICVLS